MIIGINGKSKSGKDTAADMLVEDYGFVKVALADEIKRTALRWWPAFTVEHMWGPSETRNLEVEVAPGFFLTARKALQQIGTEVARAIDPDVWVRFTLNVAKLLLEPIRPHQDTVDRWRVYDKEEGITNFYELKKPGGVVIPDCRFINEFEAIRGARIPANDPCGFVTEDRNSLEALGMPAGRLVRIIRRGAGLQGEAGQHRSETEQDGVPDNAFDYIINNSGDLEFLKGSVDAAMRRFTGRLIPYDERQADVPPFKRKCF